MSADFPHPLLQSHRISRKRFLEYLAGALGEDVTDCSELEPITIGIENSNFQFSATCDGGIVQLILRCQPAIIPEWRTSDQLYDIEREFCILQELAHFEIPTPRALSFDSGSMFGTPCFLMERLPGSSLPWDIGASCADNVVKLYANAILSVWQIDYAKRPKLAKVLPMWSAERTLAWYERRSRPHLSDALVLYALSWLSERKPASWPLVLCHGDVNPCNFLMEDGHITGIVDWEFACLRDDPLSDLACVPWLFERPDIADIFCHCLGRDASEMEWFLVSSKFGACYAGDQSNPVQDDSRARLAEMVGYAER